MIQVFSNTHMSRWTSGYWRWGGSYCLSLQLASSLELFGHSPSDTAEQCRCEKLRSHIYKLYSMLG